MGKLIVTGNSRTRLRGTPAPAVTGPALPTAIMALSPIGYWKLNESAGTTANDSSGNSKNGTYSGTGYTLQGATGGDGLLYADFGNGGNSSHVTIADDSVWSVSSSGMSWFALLKPDSVSGTTGQYWMAKATTSNFEYGFTFNDGQAARVAGTIWTAPGLQIRERHFNFLGSTSWQAIMYTATGPPSSSTNLLLYDNNNTSIGTDGGGSGTYADGTSDLRIAWWTLASANTYWAGGIAHAAIFGAALNTTQIGTIMSAADADGWF